MSRPDPLFDVELIRYYNSFNEKKTGFGYGWSAMLMIMMFIVLGLDKMVWRRRWATV